MKLLKVLAVSENRMKLMKLKYFIYVLEFSGFDIAKIMACEIVEAYTFPNWI